MNSLLGVVKKGIEHRPDKQNSTRARWSAWGGQPLE
jgi:hypothetical protein